MNRQGLLTDPYCPIALFHRRNDIPRETPCEFDSLLPYRNYFLPFFAIPSLVDLPRPVDRIMFVLAAACGSIALFFGCLRILRPRNVLQIANEFILVTCLRPGMWKLFQLWTGVKIRSDQLIRVEIGNVGKGMRSGRTHLIHLDASKNAVFQNVCVFHYEHDGVKECVYDPHTDNIEGFERAVAELQTTYGGRIEQF